MKKQVAVRFSHSKFSPELAKELGIENLIIPSEKNKGTFDIVFADITNWADDFEAFSGVLREKTGEYPNWFTCFGIDIKDQAQATA